MKKILIILFFLPLLLISQTSMNMNLLGTYNYSSEGSDIWGWYDPTSNQEYALVTLTNGLSCVNVTNPSQPQQEFFINDISSPWRDVKTWGNYAYVTTEANAGLLIVDLSDMSGNTYTHVTQFNGPGGSTSFTSAHNIYIDENGIAYIFGAAGSGNQSNGAIFLDVGSNATNPVYLGEWSDQYIHDAMVRGDTMWAGCIYSGKLYAVDVSNKSNPVTLGSKSTPNNFTHNAWVSDDGDYVFTTDETSDAYLAAYNVTNLNNIYEVDRIQSNPGSNSIPHNTFVDGNFLITSYYRDGTTVHDITFPDNMIQVAYYDSYSGSGNGFDGCWGTYPYLPSGNIISSDINSGPGGNGRLLVYGRNFQQACYLSGTVTNANTGFAVNGATVQILSSTNSTTTNLLGNYNVGTLNSGNYQVLFSATGYTPITLSATLSNGVITVLDAALTPGSGLPGCTDPAAVNYDPNATVDDGSCIFCTGSWVTLNMFDTYGDGWNGNEWSATSTTSGTTIGPFTLSSGSSGDLSFCLPDDCYDIICDYGSWDSEVSWTITDISGNVLLSGGAPYNSQDDFGSGGCISLTYGCTDPSATNYDPSAQIDDGSCTYPCNTTPYCEDFDDGLPSYWSNNGWTLNANGTPSNNTGPSYGVGGGGNYMYYEVSGSPQNPVSLSVCLDISNLTSPTLAFYYHMNGSAVGTLDVLANSSNIWSISGSQGNQWNYIQIDLSAYTGNSSVNIEFIGNYGGSWQGDIAIDEVCVEGSSIIYGCIDPTATNYNPNANTDDGSCIYCVYGCTDATALNYDPNATCDDGSCVPYEYGCTDPLAINYNSTATADDGSCLYPGCTDPNANNYDPNANFDDGSCNYDIYGCTNPSAANYNPNATIDDGSCLYCIGCTGCTDPLAINYDPNAIYDDGSCIYCLGDQITGLFVTDIIDDRCVLNFDNMNTYDANGNQICRVDQIRIRYRETGTTAWGQKNIASPTGYNSSGVCNSTQKTNKNLYGLTLDTEYEWQVKVWYCSGQTTGWAQGPNFTTAPECPNGGNFIAYGVNPTKARFTWNNSNGAYEFLRIKIRVDSISNPVLSDFIQVGGAGVPYGTYIKDKNGLTPGETYRGQGRTWCNPNGGAYNSLGWGSFGTWTQPTNRILLGESIDNLDIYPNPSKDVFHISFTSDDVQDLRVRVFNTIGEEIIKEDLNQYIGEYTKKIDLEDYSQGVYFLEIETQDGVINKKLILQ